MIILLTLTNEVLRLMELFDEQFTYFKYFEELCCEMNMGGLDCGEYRLKSQVIPLMSARCVEGARTERLQMFAKTIMKLHILVMSCVSTISLL